MPGSAAAAAARSMRATTSPASRIIAIWPGVLISIDGARLSRIAPVPPVTTVPAHPGRSYGPARGPSADEPAQGDQGPFGDVLHRSRGVDAEQYALVGVVGDQRLRLHLVDLEPV